MEILQAILTWAIDHLDLPSEVYIAAAVVGGLSFVGLLFWKNYQNKKSEERVPMMRVFELANKLGWDLFSPTGLHVLDLCDAIRQSALDEKISIWGRPDRNMFESLTRNNELLDRIPSAHWKDFWINWSAAFKHLDGKKNQFSNDNFEISSYIVGFKEKGYKDLHVRGDVKKWLKNDAVAYKGRRQT